MNTDFLYQTKAKQIKQYLHPMRQKWGKKSGDSELLLYFTF